MTVGPTPVAAIFGCRKSSIGALDGLDRYREVRQELLVAIEVVKRRGSTLGYTCCAFYSLFLLTFFRGIIMNPSTPFLVPFLLFFCPMILLTNPASSPLTLLYCSWKRRSAVTKIDHAMGMMPQGLHRQASMLSQRVDLPLANRVLPVVHLILFALIEGPPRYAREGPSQSW